VRFANQDAGHERRIEHGRRVCGAGMV
jgi:hypothetical protein